MDVLKLPRRIKTTLKADEKRFLDLYAKYNNLDQAAREVFKTRNCIRKATLLLDHGLAKVYLKDRRDEALRIAKEEFQNSLRSHYSRLQAQSEGRVSTKEIEKEVAAETGIITLRERQFDKLAATKLIFNALGETSENTQVNNNFMSSQSVVVELD
jgi:hypothetical protein